MNPQNFEHEIITLNSDFGFLAEFMDVDLYLSKQIEPVSGVQVDLQSNKQIAENQPELPTVEPKVVTTSTEHPPQENKPKLTKPTVQFTYKGNFELQVLILVHSSHYTFLAPDEETYLLRILSATKLGLKDVAILNVQTIPNPLMGPIYNHFKPKLVLLFGVDLQVMGFKTPLIPYQIQRFAGIPYLYAEDLMKIQKSEQLRMKLWSVLRTLFNV